MLCRDVMNVIEKEYPLNYALSWDNVGLLVGRDDKEVKKIYIALDATDKVIDEILRFGKNIKIVLIDEPLGIEFCPNDKVSLSRTLDEPVS